MVAAKPTVALQYTKCKYMRTGILFLKTNTLTSDRRTYLAI
jgi:hypothetical protein